MTNDHYNASIALAPWLSAALEDPNVCAKMKKAIRDWFAIVDFGANEIADDRSPWFDNSVDPVYKGWYEWQTDPGAIVTSAYWNGKDFEYQSRVPGLIINRKLYPSGRWRGSNRPPLRDLEITVNHDNT